MSELVLAILGRNTIDRRYLPSAVLSINDLEQSTLALDHLTSSNICRCSLQALPAELAATPTPKSCSSRQQSPRSSSHGAKLSTVSSSSTFSKSPGAVVRNRCLSARPATSPLLSSMHSHCIHAPRKRESCTGGSSRGEIEKHQ